ncbi:MAG: hypothetical protein IJ187_01310 [Neisseriaceae bacterium]|nr:hypothetical protein [Neisseriaceae bacterium]
MAFCNIVTTLVSIDKLLRNLLDCHDFSCGKILLLTLDFVSGCLKVNLLRLTRIAF